MKSIEKKVRSFFETVVLAVGMKSSMELLEGLKDQIPEVYPIDDCIEPRRLINAIWEGYRLARQI